MFGSKKNKGNKGKVAAAPVAAHKVTKPSAGAGNKRACMSAYFHESVVETVMPDFKANTPFEVKRNGVPAYIGLLFDTNDIGGFSRQFSDDEAKGTIIEMVNSNHIKALITENLMARECMVLIPDSSTVSAMSEFAALTDISYKLVAVTETGMTELEDSVTFNEVRDIIENNGNVKSLLSDSNYDHDDNEAPAPEPEPESDDDDVAPFGSEDDDISGEEDDVAPFGGDDEFEPEPEDEDEFSGGNMFAPDEDDEDEDYDGDDSDDGYEDPDGPSVVYDEDEEEDGGEDVEEDVDNAYIEATKIRRFFSGDLGLEVTTEPFDAQFLNSNPFVPFDEERGDGWLDGYVSQMAKDANAEMRRLHQSNLLTLRERYLQLMQMQCDDIVKELDMDDPNTLFGEISEKFRNEKASQMAAAPDEIGNRRSAMQKVWEEKLQQEGEDAAREAQRVYVERYHQQHEDNMAAIEYTVRSDIENNYEKKMRELRDRRHMEAMKRLDMSINATLIEISDMYLEQTRGENLRCKELQKEMMAYLDAHRKEDAARIAALTEKQAQENKADQVLAEQTEKLNKMTADFEARNKSIQADLEQMRRKYEDDMKHRDNEYEDMVRRKDDFAATLQKRVEDLTHQLAQLDDAKKKEYASRMSELENERDAWEDKCDHLIRVHKRSNVLSGLLVVVVIAACLAIGFVGGQYANMGRNLDAAEKRIVQSVDDRINDTQQGGIESQIELD